MAEPPLPPFVASLMPIPPPQKRADVAANRERLENDLWSGSLRFASKPRIVDVQFSNFCNMACTMCYPQGNPPLQKLADPLLEKLTREVFPTASILVPFVGSEPLVFTWELTRRLAELFGLELDIVTNVQFLDEKKFTEVEPLVTSIRFSIDSHLRDVYEKIRRKSKPDVVFRNLATAARLCREHGIEVQTNIVFMTENARHVDGTIAALADLGIPTFHLLQYHHTDAGGAASDPYTHLPASEIEAIFARIRDVAAQKRVRVVFDLRSKEVVDHRPADLALRENPKNDPWIERFRRYFPGYCLQSVNRIKVNADGSVYPCCVADGEQLNLGNLRERDFEAIWNGAEAQDLRRAMVTQDLPALCQVCSFTRGWMLPPQPWLPFVDTFARKVLHVEAAAVAVDPALTLTGPEHLLRGGDAPVLRWSFAGPDPQSWRLTVAMGGEQRDDDASFEVTGARREFTLPESAWLRLRANAGHWWTVFALEDGGRRVRRATSVRAFVRHADIPRVEGSRLYGKAPPMYHFSGTDTPPMPASPAS